MSEVPYYFNSKSTSVWSDSAYMIDDILTNYAYTEVDLATEILNGNNCPGTNLGTISKVEMRVYGIGDGDDHVDLIPVFGGITDGAEYCTTPATGAGWSLYVDITNDLEAPSPWTWADIVALDTKVKFYKIAKANVMKVSKVQIRVTYTTVGHPIMKRWHGIPGMNYTGRKGAGW